MVLTCSGSSKDHLPPWLSVPASTCLPGQEVLAHWTAEKAEILRGRLAVCGGEDGPGHRVHFPWAGVGFFSGLPVSHRKTAAQ
jgi:hypothetical protein